MPEDDVEVRLDDQKAINTFGRLNTRLHELTEEIKEKRSLHDQLDDAANELILADDDEPVRVQYGECYFEVPKDRADQLLESRKDKLSEEVAELEAQVGGIQDRLGRLKTQLYARFGGNINLEEQ